jgi:hypothetical protein
MPFHFPPKDPGETWEEALKNCHDFSILSRQERSKCLREARKRDRISEFNRLALASDPVPVASVEETPFDVPQGMSPEDATVLKIKRDAEKWPISIQSDQDAKSVASTSSESLRSSVPSADACFTGPRGGRFRINASGRKVYDVR